MDFPKLLKRWSGRWGSNPRRPAWEVNRHLSIKDFCVQATYSHLAYDVHIWRADGHILERHPVSSTQNEINASFSPDGGRMAFEAERSCAPRRFGSRTPMALSPSS